MSPRPEPPSTEPSLEEEEEAVDGEPMLEGDLAQAAVPVPIYADSATLVAGASPAVQAVAAAATGFVAGAATLAIAHRRGSRKLARSSAGRRGGDLLPILGTRSFLIDIHVLRPGG